MTETLYPFSYVSHCGKYSFHSIIVYKRNKDNDSTLYPFTTLCFSLWLIFFPLNKDNDSTLYPFSLHVHYVSHCGLYSFDSYVVGRK